ncbi:MAG: CBS domain-containing protein [Deltaproteobacteria bacterium]|nr:CBS domain-containing protein [Deltaproteobacteria bacterium]
MVKKEISSGATRSSDITVSEWMTKDVVTVEVFDSIGLARRLMAKNRINQLPVLDGDKLVGIVTDRDIRDAYPTSMVINRTKEIDRFADTYTVEEAMSFNVMTVQLQTPLATAVALLRQHRIGSLPVVDGEKLVGIITRSDILDFVLSGSSLGEISAGKPHRAKGKKASSLEE